MSDEHFTRALPIECRLMSASMEIDDDDEDVIQVSVEVSNEDAMPMVAWIFLSKPVIIRKLNR